MGPDLVEEAPNWHLEVYWLDVGAEVESTQVHCHIPQVVPAFCHSISLVLGMEHHSLNHLCKFCYALGP